MKVQTEHSDVTGRLAAAGLRPTRQRVLLGGLLFCEGHRHVTAELLYREAMAQGFGVSLATVYNTLHQFTKARLLREVSVEGGRSYFDTNVSSHHHFLCEDTGQLTDIPEEAIALANLPLPPEGRRISSIDVVIRLRGAS